MFVSTGVTRRCPTYSHWCFYCCINRPSFMCNFLSVTRPAPQTHLSEVSWRGHLKELKARSETSGGFSTQSPDTPLTHLLLTVLSYSTLIPPSPPSFGHPVSSVLCCPFLSKALPEVYYLSCCLSFAWQLYSQVHGPGQCLYRWGLMSFKLLTRLLQLPDPGPTTLYI